MASKSDMKLLKEAFCDVFIKFLPYLNDPDLSIRRKWQDFRDFLLNDEHNPIDIFLYAQQFSLSSNERYKPQQPRPVQQPGMVPQAALITQKEIPSQRELYKVQSPNKLLSSPGNDLFDENTIIKGRKQVGENTNRAHTDYQIDKYNLKIDLTTKDTIPEDNIMRVNLKEIQSSPKNARTLPICQKIPSFPVHVRMSILADITDATSQMRKHGTTLGCVYTRSHEINTGGLEPDQQIELNKIQQDIQKRIAQQDLQSLQRNNAFKECSIYSKIRTQPIANIEHALIQAHNWQPHPSTNTQKFQGRKDGRKITGKKVIM